MSIDVGTGAVRRPRSIPVHRVLPRFVRDPVNALAEFGREAGGEVVRLDLGPVRPFLVTHPDHVQRVMRAEWTNYQREGMFWRPLRRLFGAGIMGEGKPWESSRKILQPLFTARYIDTLSEEMAKTIAVRVGEMDEYVRSGRPADAADQMAGIVSQTLIRVLFGDKITREDGERLTPAYDLVANSINFRLLMPFMPYFIRVPGDRALMGAVKTIDDVMFPVTRKVRADLDDNVDVVSALCRTTGDDGAGLDDRQIRDALVSVYGAASDTTVMSLTWLWSLLDTHPEVAAKLRDEIDDVVGAGPATPEHVPRLRYTRMVLQELLRLYPAGWLFPRMAMEDGEIGGVRIKAGSQVLISPYATHRLDEFWERPLEFDPGRFAPERQERRHKYAYFPFGGGPHQCLGQYLFYVQAPLIVAAVLSRFRLAVSNPGPFLPAPAASLRPKRRIELDVAFADRARSEVR